MNFLLSGAGRSEVKKREKGVRAKFRCHSDRRERSAAAFTTLLETEDSVFTRRLSGCEIFPFRAGFADQFSRQADAGSIETEVVPDAKDKHLVPDLQQLWPKTLAVPV